MKSANGLCYKGMTLINNIVYSLFTLRNAGFPPKVGFSWSEQTKHKADKRLKLIVKQGMSADSSQKPLACIHADDAKHTNHHQDALHSASVLTMAHPLNYILLNYADIWIFNSGRVH